MEDNETKVDDTADKKEIIDEEVDLGEDLDDTPTLEDYNALKKKAETLEAQKAHWKTKAEKAIQAGQVPPKETDEDKQNKKPETKKTNTEQVNQSEIIELSRLAARGYSDEELELLKDIKSLKGYSNLSEAIESPLFKANKESKEAQEKQEKAQLGASNKTTIFKPGEKTTKEDLKRAWLGK